MSLLEKGRIVDAETLPLKLPQDEKTKMWRDLFENIPRGRAFISTEKDLGVKVSTVRVKLREFQAKGWASKGLRVSYRTKKGGVDIWIVNDAEVQDEKEAKK